MWQQRIYGAQAKIRKNNTKQCIETLKRPMMYATLNSYYILTTAVKLNAFLCDVNMLKHLPKASDMHSWCQTQSTLTGYIHTECIYKTQLKPSQTRRIKFIVGFTSISMSLLHFPLCQSIHFINYSDYKTSSSVPLARIKTLQTYLFPTELIHRKMKKK